MAHASRITGLLAAAVLLAACNQQVTPRTVPGLITSWVALGPGGQAIARALTTQAACPALATDRGSAPMRQRGVPTDAFPVRTCEAVVPPGTRAASVSGQSLPLPVADPQRILILGDTGCRLKASSGGDRVQACNDPNEWPFAAVARAAAATRPDLIIHVGDYHYREHDCPAGVAGCAGSPWGDNWVTWQADFFAPAEPLFRAAPVVFIRGNHEGCSRAGNGWFQLLDPRPLPAACQEYSDPYVVPAGAQDLLVLDDSFADENKVNAEQVALYGGQLDALARQATRASWLLTHQPMWGIRAVKQKDGLQHVDTNNVTMEAAARNRLPAQVKLVVTGHLHSFEALGYADGRPPLLVVGNGGTSMSRPIDAPLAGVPVAGTTVDFGASVTRFGFVTAAARLDGWDFTLRDVAGAAHLACTVAGARLSCQPAAPPAP